MYIFSGLSRRDPSNPEAIRMNTGKFQQPLQDRHPFIRHHITRLVMAFTEASASNEDAIRSRLKRLQDVMGRYRPCTHDPDRPDGGRVLHSTDPSQVSCSISSPGAQEGNHLRLKIIRHNSPKTHHASFENWSLVIIPEPVRNRFAYWCLP